MLLVLLVPLAGAHAAADRAVVVTVNGGSSFGNIGFLSYFMDGDTLVESYGDEFPTATTSTQTEILDGVRSKISDYAALNSYPINGNIIFPWSTQEDIDASIAAAQPEPAAAISDATGSLEDLVSKFNTLLSELRSLGLIAN